MSPFHLVHELGHDGFDIPAPGENRERRLEAADVGLILFYRECAHSAQVAPYNGPLEQMSGREERKTPGGEDRDQHETVEIAFVVGHDHQRAHGGNALGRHDPQPEGAPKDRSHGQRRGAVGHQARLLAIVSLVCAQNPDLSHSSIRSPWLCEHPPRCECPGAGNCTHARAVNARRRRADA